MNEKIKVAVITKENQQAEELIVLHVDSAGELPNAEFLTARPVKIVEAGSMGDLESEKLQDAYSVPLRQYWHGMQAEKRTIQYLVATNGVLHETAGAILGILEKLAESKCDLRISIFECERKEERDQSYQDPVNGSVELPAYEDIPDMVLDCINAIERMRLNEEPGIREEIEDFQVLLWQLREDGGIAEEVEAKLYDRYCRKALTAEKGKGI